MTQETQDIQWATLERSIIALQTCSHPYSDATAAAFLPLQKIRWCNLCGAIYIENRWIQPHWRDIMLKVIK